MLTRAITQSLTRNLTDPGLGGGTLTQQVVARLTALGGWAWDASAASVGTNYQEAARTNLVTTASQNIGSITELRGSGLHLTQPTAGTRPVWDGTGCLHASGKWLLTANVDCTGTDTAWSCASLTKSSDASGTTDCEIGGINGGGAAGFSTYVVPYSSGAGFGAIAKGSGSLASVNDAPTYPSPQTRVLSGLGRVSTDTCTFSVDNVVSAAAPSTDQGSGNYGNAPIYVGAGYNGTNRYFGYKWYRRVVTLFEPSEADKLLFQRWCAEPVAITIPQTFVLTAMGDSYTYAINGGVIASQAYVKQLDTRLSKVVWSENLGLSGNTTSNMWERRWQLLRAGTPNMAILYGSGSNDVNGAVQASPAPTSTVFSVATGTPFGVGAWITVAGESAQILSIATNAITLTAPLAGGAPAAAAVVAHDTERNLTELATYLKNAGCSRVMILGRHYDNLAIGADTTTVENAANAAARVKQQAAAAAAGVVYVDLYAWMRALIIAGTRTQGNYAEHVSSTDQHLSVLGQTTIADAIEATITAQGWT